MNMRELRKTVIEQDNITGELKRQVAKLRDAGSEPEWAEKRVAEAAGQARAKLLHQKLKRDASLESDLARTHSATSRKVDYAAQTFFLQEANLLSQDKSDPALLALFQRVIDDGNLPPEAAAAYGKVVGDRISDHLRPQFNKLRWQSLPVAERVFETHQAQAKRFQRMAPMIDDAASRQIEAITDRSAYRERPPGQPVLTCLRTFEEIERVLKQPEASEEG